jgi:hypothetical protein
MRESLIFRAFREYRFCITYAKSNRRTTEEVIKMEDLTPEQIGEMFRDLGLEGEEQRDSFRQLGSEPEEATKPPRQFFIRIVSSTTPEEERNNA